MTPLFRKNDENTGRFDCPGFASINPKPTSVHRLRPNDIDGNFYNKNSKSYLFNLNLNLALFYSLLKILN